MLRRQNMSFVAGTWIANSCCVPLFLLLLIAFLGFVPHAIVGAGGLEASSEAATAAIFSTAAAGRRSRTNTSLTAHPAEERESRSRHRHGGGGMKPTAAYCFRSTPMILQPRGRREEVSPTTTVATGSRAAAATRLFSGSTSDDGVLAPVKKKMKMLGEGDDELDTVLLYFAFGANMCPSVLVNSRGVRPFESFPAEAIMFATGILRTTYGTRKSGENDSRPSLEDEEDGEQGICLCFCHRAGYATLAGKPGPPQSWEASPGAHGVLHAVPLADLEKIAAYETGYRKRLVVVETPAGDRDVAVCFVSNPSQMLPTSVPPTSRYLALLQEGAAHHGVDERYRSWLARLPSVPPEDESASPERINTPSKRTTDAVVSAIAVAALGVASAAIFRF